MEAELNDIMAREETSANLPESEAQLRTLIDTIPSLIWTTRPDGSGDFYNKRWLDYTGLSMDEAKDNGWVVAIHPDDVGALLQRWTEMLAEKKAGEVEARFRRFDGQYRWYLFRGAPLIDHAGKVVKWYGTNTDIDERKRAEEALAKSEALLSEGQRISQTGSWIWNISTGKIIWSEEHCRIFGFRIDQSNVTLESFLQTVFPPDLARVRTVLDDAVRKSCEFTIEYRINLSDGSMKHIHSRGRPVIGELGQVYEFIGTAMDISYRYEAKLALENALEKAVASEEQLRTFIDRMPGLAWTAGPNGEAEFVSQGWLNYTGMTEEEAQGPGWANAIHPDDVLQMVEGWQKIIATKKQGELEARLRRFDGVFRWFSFRGAPLLDQWGYIVKWYGVNIDIEDRKQAEMELRQRESELRKAESDLAHIARMTTMGELAASMAHEVKQPLTAVVVNANTCLDLLPDGETRWKEIREALTEIVEDTNRASSVMTRVRNLSRKAEIDKAPIDVKAVISEVNALARYECGTRNVTISTELPETLPLVLGDRVQLQQVILNLVLNGMDAMSAVEPSDRILTISANQETRAGISLVIVRVCDKGAGIKPNQAEKLFEAFYTTKPQGMGMGLPISRSIIEAHGGKLWFENNQGPGTSFLFSLPIAANVSS